MTPQLQQAIRLLQLSSLDLKQEIEDALEANYMLEAPDQETGTLREASIAQTAEVRTDWDSASPGNQLGTVWGARDISEAVQATGTVSLREHLLWQLELSHCSSDDLLLAEALIDGIGDDGYFKDDFSTIARELEVGEDELEAVLHRLQRLDPLGIGSRNLQECLQVQLQQFEAGTAGLEIATRIVAQHLNDLARPQHERLQKKLRTGSDELTVALSLIRSLNPKPGLQIAGEPAQYIVPDVLVHKVDQKWRVELNPETIPRIRINAEYSRMAAESDAVAAGIRDQLQQARWLLRSIEIRNETLLKVVTAIVTRQTGFFEHGEEAMKPMILRDVAEAIDMHESTVSRITTQKYMHTARGIFELKYFFSSHLSTEDGEDKSSTAIRAMIKKLITAEIPGKPLSDSRVAVALSNQGIKVARRTVTKYREAMAIPTSHERKMLQNSNNH